MEPIQEKPKAIIVITVLVIATLVVYLFFIKPNLKQGDEVKNNIDNQAEQTVVEYTQSVNGVLASPKGFPTDIPFENGSVTESAIVTYPEQGLRQLSASYISSKTVSQKYTEYKNYMVKVGYIVEEGDRSSPVKALFGTRSDEMLSVVISSQDGGTLIQIAYVLKSL